MSIISSINSRLQNKKKDGLARTRPFGASVLGQAGILSQNYTVFFDLYKKNSDLRRIIKEKQNVIGNKRHLYRGDDKIEEGTQEYKRVYEVLNSVGQQYKVNFDSLKDKIIKDLTLTGNAYIHIVRNDKDEVIALQSLDARYTTIVASEFGEILGYAYRIAGDIQYFLEQDVAHIKDGTDIDNELYGSSILEALHNEILADHYANITNRVNFQNRNIPAYMIVLEDGVPPDQVEDIIVNMKQFFAGAENAGRGAVMQGVKTIQQVSNDMRDMEFTTLRKYTTERICSALGVPKIILGISEGINHTNADILYRQYIETTIMPEETKIGYVVDEIIKKIDPTLDFFFESEHLDKLEQAINIYTKALEYGILTIDEVRIDIGRTPYETDNSTRPIIKKGYGMLDDVDIDGFTFRGEGGQ